MLHDFAPHRRIDESRVGRGGSSIVAAAREASGPGRRVTAFDCADGTRLMGYGPRNEMLNGTDDLFGKIGVDKRAAARYPMSSRERVEGKPLRLTGSTGRRVLQYPGRSANHLGGDLLPSLFRVLASRAGYSVKDHRQG